MAANWTDDGASDPRLTSTYSNIINSIRERDEDVAKQFNTPSTNALLGTNHPIGTIRWDATNSKWLVAGSGSSWSNLASEYDIDVTTVKGCVPSNSSGATNLSRNNGSLQTNLIANYLGATNQDAAYFKTATNLTTGYIPKARMENPSQGSVAMDISGTASTFTTSENNSANETVYPVFVDGATGAQGAETDTGLTYNPSTGKLTSVTFAGSIADTTGISTALQTEIDTKAELAGSASQSFSAITASAGTNTTQVATTAFVTNGLATKALLAGSASQSFSATTASAGTNTTQVATTAFVTTGLATKQASLVNIDDTTSANGYGAKHISTANPGSGDGSNGDIWYKV